jgi:DNA-binding CsgD family transcriptional regulator
VPPATIVPILRDSIRQEDFLLQYRAISESPGDDMLRKLTVPTMVMATRDESLPMGREEEAKRIAAIIPNSRLVLFDDIHGGFEPSSEGAPSAITAIQRFLGELPDAAPDTAAASDLAGLSGREVEVLRLLAAGQSNQQIADALVISQNTVIRHVSNIFDKIGVANRAQATAYAKDHGIA